MHPRHKCVSTTAPEEEQPALRVDHERLKYLQDLSKRQDPTLFERLIRSFLDDAPVRIITMWHALESNDAHAFFTAAHSLKGISGNLGIMKMMEMSQTLQIAGQEGNLSTCRGAIARVGRGIRIREGRAAK